MGGGKKSRITTSKVSAAAAPSSQSTGKNRSSIIRSSFAPSLFQVDFFASVIQGFDSQRIRIHDTATGRLQCEHAIAPGATVNCLDWGFYGCDASAHGERQNKESKKKRKRTEQINGTTAASDGSEVVLAFGTSDSEVQFYSPAAATVVRVLGTGHTQGIRDFRFEQSVKSRHSIGWTIGGDSKLVRWDLRQGEMISSMTLPDQSTRTLCPLGSAILCASHKAFIMDLKQTEPLQTITASSNMVHSVLASTDNSHFLTAAETDRYIRVFDRGADSSTGELVAESEVLKVATASQMSQRPSSTETATDRALAALNKDGVIELFDSPFSFQATGSLLNSQSLKARIKQRTRKAKAQVRVAASREKSAVVPLLDVAFQDHELVFVYAESGVDPVFDRIRWRKSESTDMVLEGVVELARAKGAGALGAVITDGVKDLGKLKVNESQTVVSTGDESQPTKPGIRENDAISISSAEEDIDDYEDEDEQLPNGNFKSLSDDEEAPSENHHQQATAARQQPEGGGSLQKDVGSTLAAQKPVQTEDSDTAMADVAEAEDPSFGDMIRAVAPGVVDVQAALTSQNADAVVSVGERQVDLPSGMSLGTVLTQSLRTNDVKLLESCLHVKQVGIVRATIERLDSALASTLIQKLSERFYSRPGRAGSLLVWIQWTIVAHGGYLASQPSAMKTLAGLHKVVGERARSLPLLLSLKGKLDMLEAQMNLRATMKARSKTANRADDEDEDDVIYVEGQEEEDTDDSNAENTRMELASSSVLDGGGGDTGSEEEADEEMPMTNGALAESFDQESDSDDDEEGLIDDEAESTDGDSDVDGDGSLDEIDHEDVDSDESDVSMDEVPPAKRLATARLSNGIPRK
ncbi:MAG: hypothetical protein Q9183_002125 [Haloplaca sp. 2 TL-2023]